MYKDRCLFVKKNSYIQIYANLLKNQYLPNNVQAEYAKNNHSIFLFQVFVETLDKCFENVCELDLIFHVDKV